MEAQDILTFSSSSQLIASLSTSLRSSAISLSVQQSLKSFSCAPFQTSFPSVELRDNFPLVKPDHLSCRAGVTFEAALRREKEVKEVEEQSFSPCTAFHHR